MASKKKLICKNCYYCKREVLSIYPSLRHERWCLLRGMKVIDTGTCTRFQYPVTKILFFEDTKEILKETLELEADCQLYYDFIEDEMTKGNNK